MKLHLPTSLRAAVFDTFAAFTAVAAPAVSMADTLTSNYVYTCTTTVAKGDINVALYGYVRIKDSSGNYYVEVPYNGQFDGNGRRFSYNVDLKGEAVWVMSGREPSSITFVNMADITVKGSSQLINAATGTMDERQMRGPDLPENPKKRHSNLFLTVTDSNSFTFKDAIGGEKSSLTYQAIASFDNVNNITFSNIQGRLSYESSFSITNSKKVVFSGITKSILQYDDNTKCTVNFTDIGELRFENNGGSLIAAERCVDTTFARIDNLVISGNKSSTSLFSMGSNGIRKELTLQEIKNVEITGNTIDGSNMFAVPFTPRFVNCDSVSISGNVATSGSLIAHELKVEGATKGVYINNNKADCKASLLMQGVRLGEDNPTGGDITITGTSGTWVPTFQMNGNGNTGKSIAENGLFNGILRGKWISDIQMNGNNIDSTGSVQQFFGRINLESVGNVSINNNVLKAKDGAFFFSYDNTTYDQIYKTDNYVADFNKLTISGNSITSSTGAAGFTGSWAVVGNTRGTSTVEINNNTLSGAEPNATEPIFEFGNLAKLEISGNTGYGSFGIVGYVYAQDIKEVSIRNNTIMPPTDSHQEVDAAFGGVFYGCNSMDVSVGDKTVFSNVDRITASGNSILLEGMAAGAVFGNGLLLENVKLFEATDNIIAGGRNADGSYTYAMGGGGAVACCDYDDSHRGITFTDSNVSMSRNKVYGEYFAHGGALGCDCDLVFEVRNSDVVFTDNHAYAGKDADCEAIGGAFKGITTISDGGRIEFTGNSAEGNIAQGGAAKLSMASNITADNVIFKNNKVVGISSALGGALHVDWSSDSRAERFLFGNNRRIEFTGNGAQASSLDDAAGGAIYLGFGPDAYHMDTFYCNDSVYIRGNYITDGKTVRLQAIAGPRPEEEGLSSIQTGLTIQTKAGQTFECYDGLYVSDTLYINGGDNYLLGDDDVRYQGTVTFSGVYAAADLKALNPKYTQADLQASRTIHAGTLKIDDGNLVLDTVRVETDLGKVTTSLKESNSSFLTTTPLAHVYMHNATIAPRMTIAVGYDSYVRVNGIATIRTATFSGVNTVEATIFAASNGTWTFDMSSVNKSSSLLTVVFDPLADGDGRIYTTNQTFKITAAKGLAKGTYKLLTYSGSSLGEWERNGVTFIAPDGSVLTLGSSNLYVKADGSMRTLYYNFGGSFGRGSTTLTWVASSGTWADNTGASSGTWSAASTVKDRNFYNGDKVVFNKAATVQVQGLVSPASIQVSNTSGEVKLTAASSGGGISGSTTLTKEGAGTLTLALANCYTGATTVKAGTLNITNANALGGSAVTLSGGTLKLNSLAVSNAITAKGGTISGAGSYTGNLSVEGTVSLADTLKAGQLTVKSGTLSGGSVADTAITATGGAISSAITGGSSLISSGTVTLGGTDTYTGATTVTGGTLTVSGSISRSAVAVQSGAKLKVTGSVGGNISLNGGTLEATAFKLASGQTLTMTRATVTGNLTVGSNGRLTLAGDSKVSGALTLEGGTVDFDSGMLTVGGKLVISKATTLDIRNLQLDGSTTTLFKFASLTGDVGSLGIVSGNGTNYSLYNTGTELQLYEDTGTTTLKWKDGNGVWERMGTRVWIPISGGGRNRFNTGDAVLFSSKGTVTINGYVIPSSVEVAGTAAVTFAGKGSISGDTSLVKNGSGKLTLNATNLYKGGTIINAGTVTATGAGSFGCALGSIQLNGGTLNLNKKAVLNSIDATGGSIINATSMTALNVTGDVTIGAGTHALSIDVTNGSLTGGGITNTAVTLSGGSVSSAISGTSSVKVTGDASLLGAHTYTGVTNITRGTLTLASALTKTPTITVGSGATLKLGGTLQDKGMSLAAGQKLKLAGGTFDGKLSTAAKSTLAVSGNSTVRGDLSLAGGELKLDPDATLSVSGNLALDKTTTFAFGGLVAGESRKLLEYGSVSGSWDNLVFEPIKAARRVYYVLDKSDNQLSVSMGSGSLELQWGSGKGVWMHKGGKDWTLPDNIAGDRAFYNGDTVVFNSNSTVTITGEVRPAQIQVNAGRITLAGKGSIAGKVHIDVAFQGDLTFNAVNTFSGPIFVKGGVVRATGAGSFGSSTVNIMFGTVDLGKKAVPNNLVCYSSVRILNANAFAGILLLGRDTELVGTLTAKGGIYGDYDYYDNLSGGTITNTAISLHLGTVSSAITGSSSVLVSGSYVELKGKLSYTGATTVESGTLTLAGAAPSKSAIFIGEDATLVPGVAMTLGARQSLTLSGGTLGTKLTTVSTSKLTTVSESRIQGDLTFNGGTWTPHANSTLTVDGALSFNKATDLDLSWVSAGNGTYTIASASSIQGWENNLKPSGSTEGGRRTYTLSSNGSDLTLTVGGSSATLTWVPGSGKWEVVGKQEWAGSSVSDKRFYQGDTVRFDSDGTPTLVGTLAPAQVLVTGEGNVTFSGTGSIVGAGSLSMSGMGTLKMNATNLYTGGTTISSGTVIATGTGSFGSGDINLNGGTLDLGKKAVANNLTATGGALLNANAFTGNLTVDGDVMLGAGTQAAKLTMVSGSLYGGGISNTQLELKGGSISSVISGTSSVSVRGDATLYGDNTYTGETSVDSGTLTVSGSLSQSSVRVSVGATLAVEGSISKDISVQGGVLRTLPARMVLASGQTLSLSDVKGTSLMDGAYHYKPSVQGSLKVVDKSTLAIAGTTSVAGHLAFAGGTWTMGKDSFVDVTGNLSVSGATTLDVSAYDACGDYTLATYMRFYGDIGKLSLIGAQVDHRLNYTLSDSGMKLKLSVSDEALQLTWTSGNGVWMHQGGRDWALPESIASDKVFYNGDSVTFDSKGTVTIAGEVVPKSVTVKGTGATTFAGTGSIAGSTSITKSGTGTLTLNASNTYTGGTTISGGTVKATGVDSFGTGGITLSSGTLDLGKKAVTNAVSATGGTITNATAYVGNMTLKGSITLGANTHASKLTLNRGTLSGGSITNTDIVLKGGTVDSVISGSSSVSVAGIVTLGAANSYTGMTKIVSGGLTLGKVSSLGKGDVLLGGGNLHMNNLAVANNLQVLVGNVSITGGSAYKGTATLSDGTLNLSESLGGTLVLSGGTLAFTGDGMTLGKVMTASLTQIDVSSLGRGEHSLFSFANGSSIDLSLLECTSGTLSLQGNTLMVNVTSASYVIADDLPETVEETAAEASEEAAEELQALETTADVQQIAAAIAAMDAQKARAARLARAGYKVDPCLLGSNRSIAYKQLVDNNRAGNYTGVLAKLARTVDNATQAAEAKELMDRIGGALYTTQMSSQIDGNRAAMGTLRDVMGYGTEGVGTEGYRFAVQATTASNHVDGTADAPGYRRNEIGGLLVAERAVGDHAVAGLSVGYGHTDVKVDKLGKWESDDTRVNAHLLAGWKGWQSRTAVGFGVHKYDIDRDVQGYHASATPTGASVNVMEEISRSIALGGTSAVEPFLRIESSYNRIGTVSESGSIGNAALHIDGRTAWATTVTLGANYVQQFTLGGAIKPARFMVGAGIAKSIGDEGGTVDASFAGDRRHSHRMTGVERDRWGVKLGGSLLIPLGETQSINAGIQADIRARSTEVNANIGYRWTF